jgi:hypothetical protein
MESNYVFRTLQAKTPLVAVVLVFLASSVRVGAVQLQPSQTIKAGTKIACVLDEHLDSSQLAYGDKFKLHVVDAAIPVLHGAEIIGYITDLHKPSGVEQGRIGFFLTTIKLPNGEKKPITAYVVSRRVTQYNPAAQRAARQTIAAPMPNGFLTPGPVAWQMNMGPGGPSTVRQPQSQSLGGYVYTTKWPIVVNQGTPVTVELAENLTVP